MADTKISGLPASTTPLAGTEVLPIVQTGTTKQVSVANLTAGRDVSANIFSSAAGAVATPAITTAGDTNTGFWFPAADTIAASTAGTERMQIDSAGNVGIGATPAAGRTFSVAKNITGSVNSWAVASTGVVQSDVTTTAYSFRSSISTAASAFTLSVLSHFSASQSTIGAGSAVTTQNGFIVQSNLTGATNNYGFYGGIPSGTGRYNFYAAGTAANVFVGTTSLGGIEGAESLRVNPTASAVNYVSVFGAVTLAQPSILVQGSDTNIGLTLASKGGSGLLLYTNSGANLQVVVAHTASAVNYHQFSGSATGSAIVHSAQGSDANIDIALTTKGTGVLAFGTYTAGIIAQAGSITIKDAGGTTRRLLVG
jgi:hypothetical protein